MTNEKSFCKGGYSEDGPTLKGRRDRAKMRDGKQDRKSLLDTIVKKNCHLSLKMFTVRQQTWTIIPSFNQSTKYERRKDRQKEKEKETNIV